MEQGRRTFYALCMLFGVILALVGRVIVGPIPTVETLLSQPQTEALPAIIDGIGWLILISGCGIIIVSLMELFIIFCRMAIAKYKKGYERG